ncbi:gamma-glutamyl kinase [Aliishimia ponticola]|uniref:Gamma-glutamyl kinase n=1 Tax=Aliishimia ponticola TaxID=2499833 RepID=A0A4S4NIM1_9RHOB|nr:sulfotransferase family 2 domain-containing protein [Aliishimia ponticola]THH38577.1 gamma-glutamyl kinase [Aliishimia ponticola]
MLVFTRENLVFLAVPKTGSTAYEIALRDRADMVISNPPELKHAPVYRYNRFFRPMLTSVCGTDPELLAVIREPISWLGSWYRYRRRSFLNGKPTSTQGMSFDAFVTDYLKGQRPPHADVGSQTRFLRAQPNGCRVSHLFRYEEPHALNTFLAGRLGVQVVTESMNVSPDHSLTLDPAVEAKLRRKFAADFALHETLDVSQL